VLHVQLDNGLNMRRNARVHFKIHPAAQSAQRQQFNRGNTSMNVTKWQRRSMARCLRAFAINTTDTHAPLVLLRKSVTTRNATNRSDTQGEKHDKGKQMGVMRDFGVGTSLQR
jgi:hypothetical protein